MIQPGDIFGKLTVIEDLGTNKYGNSRYRCWCACGNEHITRGTELRNGNIKSCGCLLKEKAIHWKQVTKGNEVKISNKRLVEQVNHLAKQSGTSSTSWVEELVENWIVEHRTNKPPVRSLDNVTEEVGDEEYSVGY